MSRVCAFEKPETTEALMTFSGTSIPDTRDVRRFEIFSSTRVNPFDTESCFTSREVDEIFRSLIDLQFGNYKTFHTTEELFADLDG
jgi:hypothetical protein